MEVVMQHPQVELCLLERLSPYANNARTHSREQLEQIARSIERFGFTNPVLVGDDLTILAGHGRVAAAKSLGWREVPIIRLSHLNEAERRAYILADNKLAENAGWDQEMLAVELQGLTDLEFDLELTGFETAEIDLILDGGATSGTVPADEALDEVPQREEGPCVSQMGDLWLLGSHRLLCGDAKSLSDVERLCRFGVASQTNDDHADRNTDVTDLVGGNDVRTTKLHPVMLFTDPPYNVPVQGHVSGLGKHRHQEFAEASGELSEQEFEAFLATTLGTASSVLGEGAIAYVCMDWRHMRELLNAGMSAFDELKNLCVWNKSNAGMGSFYRSKHELVFVFKKGKAAHINNFGLGETGRYRTNVWDYAGINSFGEGRDEALAMHPTVKPVALIADAIKDCTKRGDVVLDVFGGSGSTLIAAEKTGRKACVLEIDPGYCDTIIRRWEKVTGKKATLATNDKSFREVRSDREDQVGRASYVTPASQKAYSHDPNTNKPSPHNLSNSRHGGIDRA